MLFCVSVKYGKPAHCERLKDLICQRVLWRAACSEVEGVFSADGMWDSWIAGDPGGLGGESERGMYT